MGRLCSHHKARKRRHGHPTQETISGALLKPYRRRVEACIKRNSESPCWGQLDAQWDALLRCCEEELRAQEGLPTINYVREARQKLLRMRGKVSPRDVWVIIASIYVLAEFEPRRFRNDEGFRFQLVRRVLALSDMNSGSYWNHTTRKMKRVYRDIRPRATQVIAEYFIQFFGHAGLQIAVHERQRADSAASAARTIAEGLETLT